MAKITFRMWVLIIMIALALLMVSPRLSKGVIVKSLDSGSTAYAQGLRTGMVITSINGEAIQNLQDYSAITEKINYENETRLSIKTKNNEFVFLGRNLSEITVQDAPTSNLKTGLDLSGGARAIVSPVNATLSENDLNDLISVTNERLNAFGLTDITVKGVQDLEGNRFMVVELAGATAADLRELLEKEGKFEAKISNQTVFSGGKDDIADVCRNDATCAAVTNCVESGDGFTCNFYFVVYLTPSAAKKHAEMTRNLSLDTSGQYLSEQLFLYVDDNEVDVLSISSDLRGQEATQIQIKGSGFGTTREEAIQNTRAEMQRLQTILLTGGLPFKLEIIKLDTLSPSLGKEFTKSLTILGIVVFVIVSLAIFVKYRKLKVTLAVILTMFSEALITLGIAALIKWNLDAPSIAGIIAGIGTGVNDQIVIIDEALRGQDTSESVKSRIKRALFIIVGAFITIVAAMLPLFWAGAGMLRGFALTTIIGVAVGILITRPAFSDILRKFEFKS